MNHESSSTLAPSVTTWSPTQRAPSDSMGTSQNLDLAASYGTDNRQGPTGNGHDKGEEVMKIKMLITIDDNEPDEIISMTPYRGNILIATRCRVLMLEHDEDTEIKIQQIALRGSADAWL